MPWWVWIIIGFSLIGFELFIPSGFSLLVIGISFIITAVAISSGFTDPEWLPWAICFVTSFVLFISLRKPLRKMFGLHEPSNYNADDNSHVRITSAIAPGEVGQGEMQGSQWSVRNIGTEILKHGDLCKVVTVNGLTVETKK